MRKKRSGRRKSERRRKENVKRKRAGLRRMKQIVKMWMQAKLTSTEKTRKGRRTKIGNIVSDIIVPLMMVVLIKMRERSLRSPANTVVTERNQGRHVNVLVDACDFVFF